MTRGIRSYHPFVLLLYYILVIAGLMLYQHPVFLLAAMFVILVFNFVLDNGRELKKWYWAIAVMSVLILILTPLFNRRGNHILMYLFDNPVTLESIIQGLMTALAISGILAVFVTFNILMTADKFLYLFAKLSPQWALLIMLSIRFVPLLQRKVKNMQAIQRVKGLSLTQGSIRQRARNGMQLLQMLLTTSLEDSIQAADSMTARGYGLQKRSHYQSYHMKRRDWLALTFLIGLGTVLLYGWLIGSVQLQLLPELDPIWQGGVQTMLLVAWILLVGFPIWAEGKEVIKWTCYQPKTSHLPTRIHRQTY